MDGRTPRKPNILITGTPGTGKTTLASTLAQETGWNHINVGDLIKERNLHDGWDPEFESYSLNEDKVCDELEDIMVQGGNIVDFHTCDFFPERWFQLVVVLRTDNSLLHPRLEKRKYNEKKIRENIECEIMQVILEEAFESYKADLIIELPSNSVAEMEQNVQKIKAWIAQHNAQ